MQAGLVMAVSSATTLTIRLVVPIVVGTTLMRSVAVERLLLVLQVMLLHHKKVLLELQIRIVRCVATVRVELAGRGRQLLLLHSIQLLIELQGIHLLIRSATNRLSLGPLIFRYVETTSTVTFSWATDTIWTTCDLTRANFPLSCNRI
jgi:hypothetical protein